MKKALNIFFVVLGVIFLFVLVAGAGFYVANSRSATTNNTSTPVQDKNSALSSEQEKALESFGVDPATVPTSITPEQEACFNAKLGESRVAEIKAGATPTVEDYFKAKDCL